MDRTTPQHKVENGANYDASSIQHLEGVEHVRKRPGMYVGGTDIRALHHLVYEVVDNSVDEALAGRASYVEITLHDDGSVSVIDDGAGIPVGIHPKAGISTLELVLTRLGAGGKFDNKAYAVSGGLHGVGVSAVNALSSHLRAEVKREGKVWVQDFERGHPVTDVKSVRKMKEGEITGTTIHFMPDEEIFPERTFSYETLVNRFREISFLVSGLTIAVRDERAKPFSHEMMFYFEGGLRSFAQYLNRNRQSLHPVVYAEREVWFNEDDPEKAYRVGIEVAIQYTDGSTTTELAFANTINTPDGGSHLTGLRSAITRTVNNYARKAGFLKDKEANFSSNDTLEGLTAIVSVKHPDPQFESQTKVKLMNPEVQGAVSSVLGDVFGEFLETNSREARRIIEKCMLSKRARDAAAKARDLVRNSRGNLLENTTLPGKLADCSNSNPAETELFIVEGDSAGGSAKQGRDRHFQAILPLRGKILNTERARLDKILDNNEVRALISALGVGVGDDFDLSKLRYHRIIIMTDADQDGSHITTLLLTLFFRYMTPLIQDGHLYIAQPPLYRIAVKNKVQYAYGEDDRDRILAELNTEKATLQRFKGLGEMNPDQLWDTTMNPENRTLLQVHIDDLAIADQTFDMLMGSSVPPRKRFIQTHAKNVRNLDI
ncbi:MAG: type IIA DNA topoisomerase subunit B [Chloroflexi bacterium]|nr:type IIA DNA topoisomerase subunit B [Chloroflexota bacterium]NOG65017.1 type IIA DNA topoisomerase subunit B [Chloroflexota bacterium]